MSAALLERIVDTYDAPNPAPRDPSPQAEFDDVSTAAAARAAEDAEKLLENDQVRQWIAGRIPSRRNREVFRAVVGFGRHQREVADAFGITQPRVNQILKQVGAWLGRVVAQRDQALTPAEQLQAKENVARPRTLKTASPPPLIALRLAPAARPSPRRSIPSSWPWPTSSSRSIAMRRMR